MVITIVDMDSLTQVTMLNSSPSYSETIIKEQHYLKLFHIVLVGVQGFNVHIKFISKSLPGDHEPHVKGRH